jgi:signal transduction histidine kinase
VSQATPIKILLLEDSQDDVIIIERLLRKGKISFEKLHVDSRDAYVDALAHFQPDVVLSDHALPGFNSHEALRLAQESIPDTPFILVSGAASEEFATRCLREGAADYIPKSNMAGLPTAIREALRKQKLEKLKYEKQLALKRQNRELVHINKSLDNFTYRVSHHLRGPISTAMGLLNVADQTNSVTELRPLHDMIRLSLTRLDATVKCLLDCSRVVHCEPRNERIDWAFMLKDVFARVDHLDVKQQVARIVQLQTETPAYSDPDRLVIVLANILNNAFTHRNLVKDHEPVVSVDVFTSANSISITIKDNGPGIKVEALPKVGTMFYRATEQGQGAGLGVYVCKEILATLHGTLEIMSTEGVGTTVQIELPNIWQKTDIKV